MSCIKEKRFLFWKYKVVTHRYVMHRISKFMSVSDDFHVDYKCTECGAEKMVPFVEQDELLKAGISITDIQKVTDRTFHYCELKEPQI